MSEQNIHICNPFMLRECLTMALEVSSSHLQPKEVKALQKLMMTLHHGTEFDVMELSLSPDLEEAIQSCLKVFKQTTTWRWLKGDFRDAILRLERHIHRPGQIPISCD